MPDRDGPSRVPGRPIGHVVPEVVGTLATTADHPTRIRFSSDGTLLASVGETGAVVWRVSSGQLAFTLDSPEDRPSDLDFFPKEPMLAYASRSRVKLRPLDETTVVNLPEGSSRITRLKFASNGQLVTANRDGQVQVWDPDTRKMLLTFTAARTVDLEPESGHPRVDGISVAQGGSRLAITVGNAKQRVQVWDLLQGEEDATQIRGNWVTSLLAAGDAASGASTVVTSVAFSPSPTDHLLAIASIGRVTGVQFFDGLSLADNSVFYVPEDVPMALAFSPRGRFLAVAGGSGVIYVWSVAERRPVGQFEAHPVIAEADSDWAIEMGGLDWSGSTGMLATCGTSSEAQSRSTRETVIKLWKIRGLDE